MNTRKKKAVLKGNFEALLKLHQIGEYHIAARVVLLGEISRGKKASLLRKLGSRFKMKA